MILQWTLNVEGFGKIDRASIRISPFMIFTGDNNSGKSYIMTLLWGILMSEDFIGFIDDLSETAAYKKCLQWMTCLKDGNEVELDTKTIDLFFELFNHILDSRKDALIRQVFNAEIPIKHLSLTDLQHHVPIVIKQTSDTKIPPPDFDKVQSKFVIHIPHYEESNEKLILHVLCFKIILGNLSSFARGAIYLPASRTGFMLTFKALAGSALRSGFSSHDFEDDTGMGQLTSPVSHFLSDLVKLKFGPKKPFMEIATFLENSILNGTIERDQSLVPNYYFKPNDMKTELPLHVTSSLVAELSPIVAYLKSTKLLKTMMIEEPEAHLHLDMQRHMARALVRLVNIGLPVWITTHSDTLVQQINNLIKLNNHAHQQKLAEQYQYEEIDFLDPEKVSVFQFTVKGKKTEVFRQPLTFSGFAVPTFTESIGKLTKETLDFMEEPLDEEDD